MRNCLILKVRARIQQQRQHSICVGWAACLSISISLSLPPCIPLLALQSTVVMQVNQSIICARSLIFLISPAVPPTLSLARSHTRRQAPFLHNTGCWARKSKKPSRDGRKVYLLQIISEPEYNMHAHRRPVLLLLLSHYAWVGAKLKGLYRPCSPNLLFKTRWVRSCRIWQEKSKWKTKYICLCRHIFEILIKRSMMSLQ